MSVTWIVSGVLAELRTDIDEARTSTAVIDESVLMCIVIFVVGVNEDYGLNQKVAQS